MAVIKLTDDDIRPLIISIVEEVIRRQERLFGGRLAYSEPEAAALMGMHPNQLGELRRQGLIRFKRLGKTGVRYSRRQIEKYLESHDAHPDHEARS